MQAAYFNRTPLEEWSQKNMGWVQTHGFWREWVRCMFRLAVVWKSGGWYLDPGTIVLRAVKELENIVCTHTEKITLSQKYGTVNRTYSTLGGFTERHPFITHSIHQLVSVNRT